MNIFIGSKLDVEKLKVSEEEVKTRSQKIEILMSIYRIDDRIVSAHGIPDMGSVIVHIFDKSKFGSEELFNIVSLISTEKVCRLDSRWKVASDAILNPAEKTFNFPECHARDCPSFTKMNLIHEVLRIQTELFSK